MNHRPGKVWIGTSNIVVPGNKSTFPPEFQLKSRLQYYSSLFNTVEINSSFYKTPLLATYRKWSQDVQGDFRFSIKLSKEITHIKDLKGKLAIMDQFMSNAGGLGNKKGCLLVQFPGKITLDHFNAVEKIMSELHTHDPGDEWKKAVEFRSSSWYIRETWDMLDEYGAAAVLHDISKGRLPEVRGSAGFVYIRFHGPQGDYRGSYADSFLKEKAIEIREWSKKGKEVYVYFNNTIGSAFDNSLYLKSLLGV